MCLGGGSVPQSPDVSGQMAASSAIGATAQNAGTSQINWAQGQAANNAGVASGLQSQLTPQVGTDVGANAAGANMYGSTLGALGNQLTTAQNYGNAAGMGVAQAGAEAATGQAYNAARMNNMRQLGSYGVDPSQMKSGALNLNANLQQAGAVGNAGYQAGQQRQLTGMGLVSNALNQNMMGSQVGQGYGAGANAAAQGVAGIGNQTTATSSSALSAPSQMLQTGLSGAGQSANIANQSFQDQLASYNASQQGSNSLMSGLGSVAGIAAMAMMADGGGIPKRYASGGPVSNMIPAGPGTQAIQQGATEDPNAQTGAGSFLSGAAGGAGAELGHQNAQAAQATSMLPQTEAHIQADPQMQQLQQLPTYQPAAGMSFANGGVPQRKQPEYGNPPVAHDQQPMAPPLVNIPGPWVGANGGSPQGTFVSQGASDGSGIDDQVPAKVSVGEYVIPADVVHAKGKEFFDKLVQRYHTPAHVQRQQMMGGHHGQLQ